ncbi:MAG: UTP--glucose-1-phosphate uridylyltransferase, partial [Planctomycetaceae bacterium]
MTLPSLTELRQRLRPLAQEHLLHWWDELSQEEREQLVEQIETVDLQQVCDLYQSGGEAHDTDDNNLDQRAAAAHAPERVIRLADSDQRRVDGLQARQVGADLLNSGSVGAILVAGGQGTRLGFAHPKGMFPIGPVSGHSLFRLAAEQVLARSRRHDAQIPYYIMTSRETHRETLEVFEQSAFFGLDPESVVFFCQASLPAVDAQTGRVLMQDRHHLCLSPDGHGGLLQALTAADVWQDMHSRGIEHVFYHQVDNPLVRICDPEFLGFHVLNHAQASTKVVAKRNPQEPLGAV